MVKEDGQEIEEKKEEALEGGDNQRGGYRGRGDRPRSRGRRGGFRGNRGGRGRGADPGFVDDEGFVPTGQPQRRGGNRGRGEGRGRPRGNPASGQNKTESE